MSRLTRRELLEASLIGAGIWVLGPSARAARTAAALPPERIAQLEKSPYVYISPLHEDGRESRCRGEVWFAWDRDGVVIVTARESWKARALARGLERARVWVGDFGRVRWGAASKLDGAPRFEARGRVDPDPAAFPRVAPIYARKYPGEWAGRWEKRFREGLADGSRVLIRYTPIA